VEVGTLNRYTIFGKKRISDTFFTSRPMIVKSINSPEAQAKLQRREGKSKEERQISYTFC